MARNKKSNTRTSKKGKSKTVKKTAKKKVTPQKRKKNVTQNPVDELIELNALNISQAKKWAYIVAAVIITICTFTILYIGYNIGSGIHSLESKSEQNPNWYCEHLNNKYQTEICYTPETFHRIRPEGNTYYLHCTWGDFAIKTHQEQVHWKERLLLKMYGCSINMP